ncbi:MAG: acetylglutamate kinase [Dethiobacteria bacterium]|jgi:acetylglutamate kinase
MVSMQELIDKASVLVEALPYIRRFAGKTFVIKYGGQAMISEELKNTVMLDLILLNYIGINTILVHGGGKEITELMNRLGKKPQFANGLRVTDQETMELAEMVLVGKVNKEIVSKINRHGGNAVGLSGKDGNLFLAARRQPQKVNIDGEEKFVDLGFVGDIKQVNPEILCHLTASGYIPVISPIASGEAGETLNINADHAAGALARALKAEKLILLTDVEGIFADPEDKQSLLSSITREHADTLIREGKISKGMIPKVESCLMAMENKITSTHIIDGRIPHSLLLEIFTDEGIGSMVVHKNGEERRLIK